MSKNNNKDIPIITMNANIHDVTKNAYITKNNITKQFSNEHKESLRGSDPANTRTQFDMDSVCSDDKNNSCYDMYYVNNVLQFDKNESCKNISSRNELTNVMKENFKNNKYKMRLDTDISDVYKEAFVLRNDNALGAYIQNELTPIYKDDMSNLSNNTPIKYNYSGYRIKDNNYINYKRNNSDYLEEFDMFKINDSEIIFNKDNEYNTNNIYGPKCVSCYNKQKYNTNKQRLNNNKRNRVINNDYDTQENIMHSAYKDAHNTTAIQKISNKLWNGKERFQGATNIDTTKHVYTSVLKAYAHALVNILQENKDFAPWKLNWVKMEQNINKCNWNFEILDSSDADVAYVENKGEVMKFRIRDDKRWLPISVYTYVLCHELAHLANYNEYGHGPNFQRLMHLLEVAAYELGIIKPEKYPTTNAYVSNGTTILSKDSIKRELYDGIDEIIKNGGNIRFYTNLMGHISSL